MPTHLTEPAYEEGTYVISFSLTDEDGDPCTPVSLNWTLTDITGTVINNRDAVAIDPPVASGDILLKGDDLALGSSEPHYGWRLLTLSGTYNSDLGSGLPILEEIWFRVTDLVDIT